MANKLPSALTADQLERIQSGLGFLRWTFVLMLLPDVFGLYGFGWLGALASVLGIVATTKIRRVVTEILEPMKTSSDSKIETTRPAPFVQQSAGFGGLELQRMAEKKEEAEEKNQPTPLVSREPSVFENVNWEEWIGKKLLQKAGILIVLIGMIVFLKYSFDNHLIGELGRIALSTVAAVALLIAGEWFQKKYSLWSQAFTGAGLALLYFTVWAAHVFYHEELLAQHGLSIPSAMAMGLYSLITLFGALASIRYRAQTIAWFTILGGYLTPFLINSPEPNFVSLTIYLAILTAGVLTLSWHQKWPYQSLAAFVLTQLYLFGLVYPAIPISDAQQTLIAIGFFILFALPPLLYQFRLKHAAEADDIGLIIFDGAAAFFAVVDALGGFGGQYVGLVSLILAAIYIAFAAAALNKRSEDNLLVNTYLLAGIGLIALALYAQMKWEWVAAGWAPFSVLLLLVGVRLERRSVFNCATALLGGSILFLVINMPTLQSGSEEIWHPFTSHWALLSYIVFSCLLGWAYLSKSLPKKLMPSEEFSMNLVPGLHAIIALIVFAAITFETTGLHWIITLPLAFSYLAFSVIAIIIFALTGLTVWFAAAFLVQVLVLLFTFAFGGTSGMVLMSGSRVMPFLHPWAAVSALSILVMAGFLFAVLRQRNHWLNTGHLRGLIIAVACSQVWLHLTVEIQHMQTTFLWSDLLFNRVLSAWWIIFSVPFFCIGIRKKHQFILRAAVFTLCIPLAKDLLMMLGGRTDLYEVSLWTAIPLILIGISTQFNVRDLLIAGSTMLAVTMATDMLHTLASDAGLLRTVWWAIVGLITIGIGFIKKEQVLRRLAIGIFAATVVKLLIFDFATLSTGVRIVASILTGLLLIGASYLYQRFDNVLVKSNS